MTLDLEDLLAGWVCPPGEISARMVVGRDGAELIQLRVELGVMQMFPDGRPDGLRYNGHESVGAFLEAALARRAAIPPEHWVEFERELLQTNYRRLAFSSLAEAALAEGDTTRGRACLIGCLRDIDTCLRGINLFRGAHAPVPGPQGLRATLIFNRARQITQLRVIEGQHEQAVSQAKRGAAELEEHLIEQGVEPEMAGEDPGVRLLNDLAGQLRREYGIAMTLEEQLQHALDNDDFETASRVRDELRRQRGHRQAEGEAA